MNLKELRLISDELVYDTDFELFKKDQDSSLTEETLDDFDTVFEALKVGVELELKNFMIHLFMNNIENFIWSFVSPSTETFRDAWEHVVNKFALRDKAIQDQFLNRLRILLRNIFLEKIPVGDEQTAIDLGDGYFTIFNLAINELQNKMKANQDGVSIEPAQEVEQDGIDYR